MSIFDKLIPKEVKKVFKPVAKFSKKFIPKEVRPFLPMITPFLPATGIMGALGGPMGFAKMYGANLLSQQLADPDAEFDDLNQIAALLSGTQGGLTGTETAANLRGMTTERQALMNQLEGAPPGLMDATSQNAAIKDALANRSMLTKAKDLGLEGLASASDYLQGTTETLQDIGSGRMDLFTKEGAKELAKAAAVPFSTGMGGVTEAYQRPLIREFEKDRAAEEAEIEATTTANDQERADYQMTFMRQADIGEDEIQETLEMNDLGEYYTPPVESAANGGIMGRTGFKNGGNDNMFSNLINKVSSVFVDEKGDYRSGLQKAKFVLSDFIAGKGYDFVTGAEWYNKLDEDTQREILLMKQKIRDNPEAYSFSPRMKQLTEQPVYDEEFAGKFGYGSRYAEGGIIGLKEGGMLNFGGREMDLRGGGFVPIGRKERADDVPARLSKNEFVMTADAVRAAGGGSVNKGAQRMYDIMNKLEARA